MEQYQPSMSVRTPPNHPEAERSVLGAILRSNSAAMLAMELLVAEDFYDPANREIFAAMVTLAASGRAIDIVTLDDELTRRGKLDAVGGSTYLVELSAGVPSAANVQAYISIVDEKSTLRKLIAASESILTECYAAQEETQDILEAAEKSIYDITMRKGGQELQPIQPVLISTFEKIEELFKNHGRIEGVPTGYTELDDLLTGLHIICEEAAGGAISRFVEMAHQHNNCLLGGGRHCVVLIVSLRKVLIPFRIGDRGNDVALQQGIVSLVFQY